VELFAQAGSQVSGSVAVDNPSGTNRLEATTILSDALLAPDGSILWVPAGSHPNSLTSWLDVNPLAFELLPGERRDVNYSISVPPATSAGTYWGVIFFESSAPAESGSVVQEGIGVVYSVRVGHIIYVTV